MSDLNEWLKERRVYAGWSPGHWIRSGHEIYCRDDGKEIAEWSYLSDAEAIVDAHNTLPDLLTAVEKVLELIEFMETDAENWLNAGHLHASEVLLENAGDLRQAIEGAIK